jgi:hypothetical protein
MSTALRLVSGSLLLVALCNVGCDETCDERCNSAYDDCIDAAGNDYEAKAECESEIDQCRGLCGSEPIDFGERR